MTCTSTSNCETKHSYRTHLTAFVDSLTLCELLYASRLPSARLIVLTRFFLGSSRLLTFRLVFFLGLSRLLILLIYLRESTIEPKQHSVGQDSFLFSPCLVFQISWLLLILWLGCSSKYRNMKSKFHTSILNRGRRFFWWKTLLVCTFSRFENKRDQKYIKLCFRRTGTLSHFVQMVQALFRFSLEKIRHEVLCLILR